MRHLCLCLLAILPMSAAAASLSQWLENGAELVEIDGTVEVPLYRGKSTGHLPAVVVTIPGEDGAEDKTSMFNVSLDAGANKISKGQAKSFGWTIKEKSARAIAPVIQIGDLTLKNVRFQIIASGASSLALGNFEELAYAHLPSRGVLAFSAQSEVDALFSGVNAPVEGARVAATGPYFHNGKKMKKGGYAALQFPLTVEGRKYEAMLDTTGFDTVVGVSVNEQPEETYLVNGKRLFRTTYEGLGQTFSSSVVVGNSSRAGEGQATLGYDQLMMLDVAVDPVGARFAIKKVETPTWANSDAWSLEQARDAFEKAGKTPEKVEGAPNTPSETPEKAEEAAGKTDAARHAAWSKALRNAGQRTQSAETAQVAVEKDPENCAYQLGLAMEQLQAGQSERALKSAQKAGELWSKWSSQKLATRIRIENKQDVAAEAYTTKQSDDCHKAYTVQAYAHSAMGDSAAVESVFKEHMDLNADLALAYAFELIRNDTVETANGPLRQAVNLGSRDDADTRVALGIAAVRSGNAVVAARQLDRIVETSKRLQLDQTLAGLGLALELGEENAANYVKQLLDSHPHSAAARLVDAYYGVLSGGTHQTGTIEALDHALHYENVRYAGSQEKNCLARAKAAIMGDEEAITRLKGESGPVHLSSCAAATLIELSVQGDADGLTKQLEDSRNTLIGSALWQLDLISVVNATE